VGWGAERGEEDREGGGEGTRRRAGEGEQRGSWAGAERGEERAEAPTSLLFVSCGVWYSGSSRAPHASKNLATGPKVIHAPPCIFPS
jgi:hypothetical protein